MEILKTSVAVLRDLDLTALNYYTYFSCFVTAANN